MAIIPVGTIANSAFLQANIATATAMTAYLKANASYALAQTAYNIATNSMGNLSLGNSILLLANTLNNKILNDEILFETIASSLRLFFSTSIPPSPTPVPNPTPTPVPTPTDINVYPLRMPSGVANGATVNLGTGPDTITLAVSNYVLNYGDVPPCAFSVVIDGVLVAAALVVSAYVGMSATGNQYFNINGSWGSGPHSIELVPAILPGGAGLAGLWINGFSYNFLPVYYNGPSVDARGAKMPPNSSSMWDNIGAAVTWTTVPIVVTPVAPAPPPATATVISGATINGVVAPSGTLDVLIAATPTNGTLTLPAGNFIGAASVPIPMTITGAGIGKTIINGTGFRPYQDKGLIVPLVPGIVISNLSIENAQISAALGNNAAGVRDSGPGVGFTLDTVEIFGCQNGVLTFPSNFTLKNCVFHDNGSGDQHTHEMYFGGDTNNTVTLNNTNSAAGAGSTHALKSRAGTTNVAGGTFTSNPDSTGNVGGSTVDIPDAGICNIIGSTLILPAPCASGNHAFLTYGLESGNNLAIGNVVTLTNVVFNDLTGTGGLITGIASATLKLIGCTYTGSIAPVFQGWGTVSGVITKV